MSTFSAALDNAFESKQLRYIAVDDECDDYKEVLTEMINEAPLQALSSEMLIRPQGKTDVQFLATMYRKALLGVAICLRPSEEEAATNTDKKKTKPTIIGTLCIGWGGIPDSLRHNRNAYLGITLARAHRGRGYGREALDWGVDWAFRHGGLHSLSLTTVSFNGVGQRLYEAAGFALAGRRREVAWVNRVWHDELTYSMTETEWEALRGLTGKESKEEEEEEVVKKEG
ncbi:Acyl-CoA N-acyltransferase [Cordyceps fumosorosea ARSEF 2679]|uniref:Acyl-CoA N-acyltransferase n=1 Tax=Cordyceps fumosorosea (strain ARSEF 2679) TaxID=1081104 RepID=A0A167M845_CORFA|nr:Acyl-CoA N-acyltransferase [Cordyceps fumosorosea ARSEF 2679]OAA54049.1 Acyl-CoA N-acyltransferase [Cordyceps fumosorosea ARSEF 2679]